MYISFSIGFPCVVRMPCTNASNKASVVRLDIKHSSVYRVAQFGDRKDEAINSCSSRGGSNRRISQIEAWCASLKTRGTSVERKFVSLWCEVSMIRQLTLVCSIYCLFANSLRVTAQAAPNGQNIDSCASLTLPPDINREKTITISRALKICDDLHKVFDRAHTAEKTLEFAIHERAEESAFQPGEIDRLLQQPEGQDQLLRQLAREVEQARQERNALSEQLESRLTMQKVTTKTAALASDSNRVRLQVQNVLMTRRVYEAETEIRRYQRTKFLNAFLGTSVSTIGTGLQLNDSVHVQHVGDVMGVVGGGLTAFFNICTADWNVKDDNPEATGLLFSAFATDDRAQLVPEDVWESLDPATKEKMKRLFTMNQGHTDLPLLHLSCHWGSGPHYKNDAQLMESVNALQQLDSDLAKVNLTATTLLQTLALQ